VQCALATRVPTFRDLLGATEGADPPSVLSILQGLASADHANAAAARAVIAEAHIEVPESPTPLPIPHPLDFAWMFATPTQIKLVERIAASTVSGDLVAHLGTPTLHERALRALPDRRHILFDRDPRRVDAANALAPESAQHIDLLQRTPAALGAALAVADPPWYTQHAIAFTYAASAVLRADAPLLLTFPASLTRPGIVENRDELKMAAQRSGMSLMGMEANVVRYDTPAFERAAMHARGIPGTPADWRVGDLLSLAQTSQPAIAKPARPEEDWVAVEIDAIPLRTRPSTPPRGEPLIGQLVDGDVLQTVSARAPERTHAALWTSRNRIYCSSDPKTLASVLRTVADGGLQLPSDPETQAATLLIADIVARERREHGLPARNKELAT
jgi:hypothetical protein